jgi:hypothetical protein
MRHRRAKDPEAVFRRLQAIETPPADVRALLADAGFSEDGTEEMAEQLDAIIAAEAVRGASAMLRHLLYALDGTAAGVALQRVILGDQGESLRDAASRAGKSHVALHKHERQVRERLTAGPGV